MKTFVSIFSVTILLSLSSCQQNNDNPHPDEPALEDQEFYFNALVNNQYWEADTAAVYLAIGYDTFTNDSSYSITANHLTDKNAIQLCFPKVKSPGTFAIYKTTKRLPHALFNNYSALPSGHKIYATPNIVNWDTPVSEQIGEVSIKLIKRDYIKATFNFTAYTSQYADTISVTEGEFFMKWGN
ncbi:hypothetical protein DMA11_15415 [Marinilabiliaceae bacterium JC017]|nr:hypothetical protein DMA11_15415 [Marinilabiliaceae bacterium JC017]